ncbi:MAG: carboxymuconolactone decarboxylase family protein [Kistimonas sp.]|nr:carboxymuconolactone decarboxylase family protein [Kistimonas sp.]
MSPFEKHKNILEVFSDDVQKRGQENLRPVFPDLVDHLVDDIYGFAYSREILDAKTRHLVSLGILSAIGGCENQLKFQLKAGLHMGLTEEEIKEVFIQVCVFAGNARAINAAL